MTCSAPRHVRVYLAGPAQQSLCSWLDGQHVLENFENNLGGDRDMNPDDSGSLARYRLTFESMAGDLGAYMLMAEDRRRAKKNKPPLSAAEKQSRKEAAMAWAVKHGNFYDWTSSYDDIKGGADGNRRNWVECKDAGIPRLMPVFHQGEPLPLLAEYCAGSDYVGLGFQRPIQDEARWLDSCFSVIPEGKWVHGFAMTGYLRWPFTSADSKTWLHEVLAMESASGQGRSALAYLTKRELVDIVVKKYQRQWKADLWRGTFGAAAGRGEQVDLEEVIAELRAMDSGVSP